MFKLTKIERIKLYIRYFIKWILQGSYEIECKQYVDIKSVSVNGSWFHLLLANPASFDFLIMEEAISEEGQILRGITTHKAFDIGFYEVFKNLLPNREGEIRSLVESSYPYFSDEFIVRRWAMISQGIKTFGVREEVHHQEAHLSAIRYLVKSDKCRMAFFLGAYEVEAFSDGEENARAKAAAALAKAGADLGIGIIHTKDSTVICIDGKNGIVSTVIPHTAISLEPEDQIPKIVVEQIAIILEEHFDVHSTLSFRL